MLVSVESCSSLRSWCCKALRGAAAALGVSCRVSPGPVWSLEQDLVGAFPGLCLQIIWLGLLRLLAHYMGGVVQS